MRNIKDLEGKSIYIIREARAEFGKIACLWSMGKDSTCLLWLLRKAFFGEIPFSVIHIDTGYKFKEMYQFRDELVKKWKIKLIVAKNRQAIQKGVCPEVDKVDCCIKLKTEALKQTLEKYQFEALLLAIRRDEHGIRAKERYFSQRSKDFIWDYIHQPLEAWGQFEKALEGHLRIHPILHWEELDVWRYIREEKIPVNPLYFSKKGMRFRSLGCSPCTVPIKSKARTINQIINELKTTDISERDGRLQDKERLFVMQKLRALGYM